MRKNGKKSIKTKKKTKSNVDMVEFDFTKMLAGRPTIMTEAIVAKLEMAFSLGANDSMACRYAGIDRKTLWDYVITHELCHMKYKNHDKQFFKLLNSKYPKWEKVKEK